MSIFFRGKKIPVPENMKKPLAWVVLVLALLASFGAGYLLRGEETNTPIVVEQRSK